MSARSHLLLNATVVAMIAFPKSGFALGGIPFNTLYLIAAAGLPLLFLYLALNGARWRITRSDLYLMLLVPFWLLFALTTMSNGIGAMASYAGYVSALIVMPVFFFALFKTATDQQIASALGVAKVCIRFAAAYGVVLFAFKTATGSFFELPGLTTTFGAEKTLEERMNDRGALSKLVSTYNNGNIYGVCMLMLLPLYKELERSRLWFALVVISIVLTLSRTSWLLLMAFFLLDTFASSRTVSVKRIAVGGFLLSFASLAIVIMMRYMERDSAFLLDSSLGGRSSYLRILFDADLIASEALAFSYEIPYVSIAEFIGLLGIPLFLLFFSNIVLNIGCLISDDARDRIRKRACHGCFLYFLATFSDAALILVPTFAIFSFLAFLSFREIPYENRARRRDRQGRDLHVSGLGGRPPAPQPLRDLGATRDPI
ncbi:hypothetical protein [Luteimonas abyssi]|uniref:hypothetical protein n=1 Tax=Luteimonas abyssi TaxID=1247514 RepID=UPI000737CD42|nr:hypothetical protein [Luteimonas abyssi]